MEFLYIALIVIGALLLISLITALVCFFMVFYSPKRRILKDDEYEIPDGEIYEPYREQIVDWIKDIRKMPHEQIVIKSFDGLNLYGYYYEYRRGAPTELLFHGYRGNSERDLCGGVHRCFSLGRNALIIDHRASGRSEGHVITFGIKESRDALSWIEYVTERFGSEEKIILTGISMGAATVLMATKYELPPSVVCVLADCPYTSPKQIISKVIADMKLPVSIFYPFVRLGAAIFGGFDLESNSPIEAVKGATVPIILIHGDDDAFVPLEMSREIYDAIPTDKKRFIVSKGAGHGLAFPSDKDGYVKALYDFQEDMGYLLK